MNIFVNGQLAAIKAGSTFEYIQENRLFTEAEGYSLEIEFPLKGCLQNQRIFGLITLVNALPDSYVYDMVIQDVNLQKTGKFTVTSVNDISVKGQFLEGVSADNSIGSVWDNTYINQVPVLINSEAEDLPTSPIVDWQGFGYPQLMTLPWVNNYSGNIQNEPVSMTDPSSFKDGVKPSYQIGMVCFINRLASALGITINTRSLPDKYKDLVICNALPSAWNLPDPCYAMPHWTVREFLDKLAILTGGAFEYSSSSNTATYKSSGQVFGSVVVEPDKIVDAYEMEISDSAAKNYAGATSLAYAERGDRMWKYDDCDWLINYAKNTGKYYRFKKKEKFSDFFKRFNKPNRLNDDDVPYADLGSCPYPRYEKIDPTILYEDDYGCYLFTSYSESSQKREAYYGTGGYHYPLCITPNATFKEINRFHPVPALTDDAEEVELDIVPAWIDVADGGDMLFIEHGEFGSDEGDGESQLPLYDKLSSGSEDKEDEEFLNQMYVAFAKRYVSASNTTSWVCPSTDGLELSRFGGSEDFLPRVYPDRKYKFKFLSADIPNVNAIFHIRGKRFLCSQLSTVFTTDGKSELIKGEFFLIAD